MKTIIVLGATGQLGAYTSLAIKQLPPTQYLLADGVCAEDVNVVAVGRRKSDNGFFKTKGIRYIGGLELDNPISFKTLPTDVDAVVHLAGTMPAHADSSPMPYVRSIVEGMVNLCEWLKTTSCRRVIFNTTPSDVCAFFGTGRAVADDAPRSFPHDGGDHAVYAIAKNAAVDILEHYKYSDGISSCVFRHLTVYGYHPDPWFHLNGVRRKLPWRQIMEKAQAGETVEIWGDCHRKKELLYIKDFANAVICALKSGAEGIFNLSGDRPYTLEEQVLGIVKAFSPADHPSPIVYCPEKTDTPQNLLQSDKARRELGWTPRYDWYNACLDMKQEMAEEPMSLLWGRKENFLN